MGVILIMAAVEILLPDADSTAELRVYVHYPFCDNKCGYCAFPSVRKSSLEQSYLDALYLEISRFRTQRNIISIYIGGGTPSLINPSSLYTLIEAIKQLPLIKDKVEITLELHPKHYNQEYVDGIVDAGVNRISLGIESFLPDKLALLNRPKTDIQNVLVPNHVSLSIDLMIGTIIDEHDIKSEIYKALKFKPDHISIYPLSLEMGSAYYFDRPSFISNNVGMQYEVCEMELTTAGYIRYESSNYSLSDEHACVHNMGYWNNDDYVGFGVASNSKIGVISMERNFDIVNYITSISNNKYVDASISILTNNEYAIETLLMGLRLASGVDIRRVLKRGDDIKALMLVLDILCESGLVILNEGILRATRPMKYDVFLDVLNWGSEAKNGWRKILPGRLLKNKNRNINN